MWQKRNKKRILKGSVTVFALLLMFILAVATIGIITTATIERKTSISTGNSTTAFQIAESGMEKTLQTFKSGFGGTLNDINGATNCSGGIVKYDATSMNTIRFKDNAATPAYITDCNELISKVKVIKSIGTTKQETRAIEEDVFLGATKLLLHLNGWNSSNSFDDSSYYWSNRTITNPGNKVTSNNSDPKKFDAGAAANFDGTGYLSVLDSSDWTFGTGDFTVDFWANFDDLNYGGVQQDIIGQNLDGSNWWFIYKAAAVGYPRPNELGLASHVGGTSGGVIQMSSGWSASPGVWYHIAFVRSGATGYIFINGVSQALKSYTLGDWADINAPLRIGQFDSYPFKGYIDELRISKGVARWTSDFTPPAKEYWPD